MTHSPYVAGQTPKEGEKREILTPLSPSLLKVLHRTRLLYFVVLHKRGGAVYMKSFCCTGYRYILANQANM